MRISNDMNTINNLNISSSNLRGISNTENQIPTITQQLETSKNTNKSIPKVEYTPTEVEQILTSIQRDLNPLNVPTIEMINSMIESKNNLQSTSALNNSVQINTQASALKLPKTELLSKVVTSSENSFENFVKTNNISQSEIDTAKMIEEIGKEENLGDENFQEILGYKANITESTSVDNKFEDDLFDDSDLFG